VVILFNRRDINVQFGTPIVLREIADRELSDAVSPPHHRLVRTQFKTAHRVAGPGSVASPPDQQLVASRSVRVIAQTARKRLRRQVVATVANHARAIASVMSYVTIAC
jgi:hypothetical protein